MENIKIIEKVEECNNCDKLLSMLIKDENKYDKTVELIDVKDYFSKIIHVEGMYLIGAFDKENVVGYLFIKKINDLLSRFDGIYVLENYRNKKIASKLISYAFRLCKEKNIKCVDINVMYQNEIARKLYGKFGFNKFKLNYKKEII